MKAHENILIFYKQLPTYNPIKTTGHLRKVSLAHHKSKCKQSTNYNEHLAVSYDSTDRFPRTILKFKSDKQKSKLHPNQKPVALCEYFIKTYSNPGELILDNTCGSGTTGVAACNLGRRSVLIDKDPAMEDKINSRFLTEQLS